MSYNQFKDAIAEVTKEAFKNSYEHYKDAHIRVTLEHGVTFPTATVIELGNLKGKEDYAFTGEGQTYSIEKPLKEFLVDLGRLYFRKIQKSLLGQGDMVVPSAIIVSAECYYKQGKNDGLPLQDKNGKPINGAKELYAIIGRTVAGDSKITCYDIIRSDDNKIIDLVEITDLTDKNVEQSNALRLFFRTLGDESERVLGKDFLQKAEKEIQEMEKSNDA